MKILFVGNLLGFGNANKHYMIPQKMMQGFIRAGHTVYAFNDREYARASTIFGSRSFGGRNVSPKTLEIAADFQPDLVVIASAEMVNDDTLLALKERHPGLKTLYLNIDSLTQKNNEAKVRRKLGIVDGIFITTGDPVIESFETPETFVRFLPNPIDASIDSGRAFATTKHLHDVFLAAHIIRDNDDPRARLIKDLESRLSDLRLGFYGSAGNGQSIYGAHYLTTLERSKIGLSLNRNNDYQLYASDRMAHYLGNGLLTALLRGVGFERWFDEDEVIFFNGAEDLEEGIRQALADDGAWRQRAERAWAKAHRLFASDRLARYMIETTYGRPFSESYEWPHGREGTEPAATPQPGGTAPAALSPRRSRA